MGLTQGMQKATLFLREELRRAKQAIAAQEKNHSNVYQMMARLKQCHLI